MKNDRTKGELADGRWFWIDERKNFWCTVNADARWFNFVGLEVNSKDRLWLDHDGKIIGDE